MTSSKWTWSGCFGSSEMDRKAAKLCIERAFSGADPDKDISEAEMDRFIRGRQFDALVEAAEERCAEIRATTISEHKRMFEEMMQGAREPFVRLYIMDHESYRHPFAWMLSEWSIGDTALRSKYMESGEPTKRMLYFAHVLAAQTLVESLRTAWKCLLAEDALGAADAAYRAGRMVEFLNPHRLDRMVQLDGLASRNSLRRIGEGERSAVEEMNEALKEEFPKPGPRFDVIAERLNIRNSGRVRYIIEGPRRKK